MIARKLINDSFHSPRVSFCRFDYLLTKDKLRTDVSRVVTEMDITFGRTWHNFFISTFLKRPVCICCRITSRPTRLPEKLFRKLFFIVWKSFLLFVSVRFHGIRLNRKTRERALRGCPLFPFSFVRSRKKRHELESSIRSKQLRSASIRFEANTWFEFRVTCVCITY